MKRQAKNIKENRKQKMCEIDIQEDLRKSIFSNFYQQEREQKARKSSLKYNF